MKSQHLWIGLVVAAGCTKTVSLKETIPVAVVAATPAPPPAPEPPPRVEVKQDRIEVNETILFAFNEATIAPESYGLLDEIAKVVQTHPELTKIRIEGHTDSVGSKSYNLGLSKRRAAAVMQYLTTKGGIENTRLVSEGYGMDKPIADNDSDEGRAKNRRVAFTILERKEAPAGDTTAAAAPATATATAPTGGTQ